MVDTTQPFTETDVCLWAESHELAVQKKQLNFEICGTETVTLNNASDVYLNYTVEDNNLTSYNLNTLFLRFLSSSVLCPITNFELKEIN